MGRIPDWSLVTGAATFVYIQAWLVVAVSFDGYWTAYTVAFVLMVVGLIGKMIQGVAWIARRMKGT